MIYHRFLKAKRPAEAGRFAANSCQLRLERDLHAELHLPRRVLCAGRIAKAGISDDIAAGTRIRGSVAKLREVYVIEAVVALNA